MDLDQSRLDQIAEEFSSAIRRGEDPSIDAYVEKHGDVSNQLRNLLASIAMIEGLKKDSSDSNDSANSFPIDLQQLDDYTIVREIGRGGMGIVFEAIHQSLGRRVAVKVLSSGKLGDTKHLARFRREARAAARLRHTNIVPVFGAGSCGEYQYYVMDLIDGMSLRQWLASMAIDGGQEMLTIDAEMDPTDRDLNIDHLSSDGEPGLSRRAVNASNDSTLPTPSSTIDYFRWVAQIGERIADALQYAHTQGVLHRDIKPANLLMDRGGNVWIADFGLAKVTEQQAVTMTGDVVGTPQYMPPESFEGNYDVKSEIYAVGLTLYELLTQRPAIEGRSPGDVIRKASRGVLIPPRKLNHRIPRDLETIVLKAVALDPHSRYSDAGALRDDLRRYLEDRPIGASIQHDPKGRALRTT